MPWHRPDAGTARITTLGVAAGAMSRLPPQSQAAPEPSEDEVRERVEKLYPETENPTEECNSIRENQKNLLREVDGAHDRGPKQ
ncbi:hypothetical protein AB0I51_12660 [Streptomyces sp. NPDC050549]|uniref:hypothetical protein n=1 Tax=Streptomyces sp. NPDC050549 TaxID=3155406 RepID=UPI003424F723